RYPQPALHFLHQFAFAFQGEQHIKTVAELADGVRQTALAHTFNALHGSARPGDLRLQGRDQLLQVFFADIRTDDEHQFISTLHSYSPNFFALAAATTPEALLPGSLVEAVHSDCAALANDGFHRICRRVQNLIHELILRFLDGREHVTHSVPNFVVRRDAQPHPREILRS